MGGLSCEHDKEVFLFAGVFLIIESWRKINASLKFANI